MEEGFLTTFVAGGFAALLGAIATYYFAKKHREAEAAYKLNQHCAEMLRELRMQAMPVLNDFVNWTMRGREALEVRANKWFGASSTSSSWEEFWRGFARGVKWRMPPPLYELTQDGMQLEDATRSLVLKYRGFQGDLDQRARFICGQFPEELHNRQHAAYRALVNLEVVEREDLGNAEYYSKWLREAMEAFESAQAWDYTVPMLEFEAEVARLRLANARK